MSLDAELDGCDAEVTSFLLLDPLKSLGSGVRSDS